MTTNYKTKTEYRVALLEAEDYVKQLKQELRAAKREKRVADKLLKGQALNDSRIIGEMRRELRKAEAKLKVADAMLSEIWGAHNRIGDALKMPKVER